MLCISPTDKLKVEPLFAASLVLYDSEFLSMHRNNDALKHMDPSADFSYITVNLDSNCCHLDIC